MFKERLQEMLETEMSEHLGHEKYEYTQNEKNNIENKPKCRNITII